MSACISVRAGKITTRMARRSGLRAEPVVRSSALAELSVKNKLSGFVIIEAPYFFMTRNCRNAMTSIAFSSLNDDELMRWISEDQSPSQWLYAEVVAAVAGPSPRASKVALTLWENPPPRLPEPSVKLTTNVPACDAKSRWRALPLAMIVRWARRDSRAALGQNVTASQKSAVRSPRTKAP
jgi:hypothetical protein